uniref:NADH-ubiquinone oxidoreductase chain 3 n=1 Tax=Clinostomum complanatum TaxID=235145 RepID=A0A649X6J2_CLICO|nr:NADH dehydrogenase subunit 3 [Clinostomum complanatum]UYP50948.1 NADH dehydrogenase subunit 3 [Clinostomum complanatum]
MLGVFSLCLISSLIILLIVVYHWFGWNVSFVSSDINRLWVSSFECGFLGSSLVENVFSYTYFILLVFFVVFDLEISLLLNLPYQGVLFKNFIYYYFFIFLLCVGYSFEVSKGYVDWVS